MKRAADENRHIIKRARAEETAVVAERSGIYGPGSNAYKGILDAGAMQLSGHSGPILRARFSSISMSEDMVLATASSDKTILLWRPLRSCENYGALEGHKGAVLDIAFADNSHLYSSSSDGTVAVWDLASGQRQKRFRGHTEVVNAVDVAVMSAGSVGGMVASASDDASVKIWDLRSKYPIESLDAFAPMTAVAFGNGVLFSGGLDETIQAHDPRMFDEPLYQLHEHSDMITSLSVSHDRTRLLSNSRDNTCKSFNIQPFATSRILNTFNGAVHGPEHNLIHSCWTLGDDRVASGAADGTFYVWDSRNARFRAKVPGHKGCVNSVEFTEGLVVSASSDGTAVLAEIAV